MNDQHKKDKELTKQDKSKANKSVKNNPHTKRIKQETDYFMMGPGTEDDWVVSAETALKMHDEFSDIFTELGTSKALSPYRSKMMQRHTRHSWHA